MKALVLAGGLGKRLYPLTKEFPKQLLPVAGKPILFHVLDSLADAGLVDVGVVTGYLGDMIRDAVGDGSRWGMTVTYITQELPLGLAHAVRSARPFLGEERFVLYLGDNLLHPPLLPFAHRFLEKQSSCHLLLTHVPNPSLFGIAVLDDNGVITKVVEKPKQPPTDLALCGVYFFDKTVHDVIDTLKPSARGEYEITDAIQGLIERSHTPDRGRVTYDIVNGFWKDVGDVNDFFSANTFMYEQQQKELLALPGANRIHVNG